MTKRARTSKSQDSEKALALLKAEQRLVDQLIAEDPRLRTASKQARYSANGDDGIGEDTLQIYRQRLRE
jgi:hypothetical protein